MYLVDTNVWVSFLRNAASPVVLQLQSRSPREIRTCAIVVAELYYGCVKSAQPVANRARVDQLIAPYFALPFDQAAAEHFAQVRRHLESIGTPIGPYDLQIAAIALAHRCTLVTHNVAEFQRVPGLTVEDWESG